MQGLGIVLFIDLMTLGVAAAFALVAWHIHAGLKDTSSRLWRVLGWIVVVLFALISGVIVLGCGTCTAMMLKPMH